MAINRYSTISEKDFDLYVPPVQAIGAALETAQKTYDTNFMFANELKNKYINARSQDRARANELQTGWEQQVDDLVKKYNGDYSTATKDLYLLQKDIEKQYRQGGEAAAIEMNYNLLEDSKKRNQERLAKGEITQSQYENLYNYVDKNFTGTKKQDDGTYGLQSIPELAKYVDAYKLADDATKNLKPRTRKETTVSKDANGFLRYDTREVSGIDPTEVQDAIEGAIVSNEQYYNYAVQLAQLAGHDDPYSIIAGEIEQTTRALGPTRSGVFSQTSDIKLDADPFKLAKQKHMFALAEEYNKQKGRYALAAAKGELQTPEGQSNLRIIGTVENNQSKYKPLNGKLQSYAQGFNQSPMGIMIDAATRTLMPGLNPVPFGSQPVPMTSTVKQGTIDQVIKSPKDFPNINVNLLATIKAANPKYTERQVMDEYDRSLPRQNNSEAVFVDGYRNSDTAVESAKLVLPQLQAGNAKAMFIGNDGKKRSLNAEQQQEYAAMIQGGKIGAIGQSRGFSADIPVGETFPVPNGHIIVSSNSVALNQYNEYMRPKLFDFIGDGRMAGEPVEMADGSYIMGIKMPQQKQNEQGLNITTSDVVYVASDKNGTVLMKNGQPDYYTEDEVYPNGMVKKRYATPMDVEYRILGSTRYQDMPRKTKSATKDYNNQYED